MTAILVQALSSLAVLILIAGVFLAVVKASAPSWFVFILSATVAALLGDGLYSSYRRGAISYSTWHGRNGPYRRTTEPLGFWLHMAMTGFGFIVVTVGAALMLFLIVMRQ